MAVLLQQECNVTLLWKKVIVINSFSGLLDGVIDVDFSISRVLIHGHLFRCCLTTGREPGERCEMSALHQWFTPGQHYSVHCEQKCKK